MSQAPNFHTEWTKDCKTEEEKQARILLLKSSKVFSELILKLLAERSTHAGRITVKEYDTPAWQYKLAHRNGQLEELEYLTQLLRPLTSLTKYE